MINTPIFLFLLFIIIILSVVFIYTLTKKCNHEYSSKIMMAAVVRPNSQFAKVPPISITPQKIVPATTLPATPVSLPLPATTLPAAPLTAAPVSNNEVSTMSITNDIVSKAESEPDLLEDNLKQISLPS